MDNLHFDFWTAIFAKPAIAALSAQVSSQVFKIFLPLFKGKPPDVKKFLDYGDIPSAHTAFIVAVTVAIGLTQGWMSPIFSLAGVVSGILIYDIIKLRKAVEVSLSMGQKCMEHNRLTIEESPPQFKGHSVLEVVVGGIWGTACAIVVCLLVP